MTSLQKLDPAVCEESYWRLWSRIIIKYDLNKQVLFKVYSDDGQKLVKIKKQKTLHRTKELRPWPSFGSVDSSRRECVSGIYAMKNRTWRYVWTFIRTGYRYWRSREEPSEEGKATTPVFLPRESRAQESLVGHSPGGHKELHLTEVT